MSALPLVIVGGGLAGGLAALALAKQRADVPFLLLEQGSTFGGNHVWSFFDTDLDATERRLVDPLVTRNWPDHEIVFPRRLRKLAIGYNSVRSDTYHARILELLRPERYRLESEVQSLAADHVIAEGEKIAARAVIDARGPGPMSGLDLGWQKFVGHTYAFDRGHGVARPVIMDGTVVQKDGFRFLYSLPFSSTELMVEDTYYSSSPHLDVDQIGRNLTATAGPEARLVSQEQGVLPVLLSGALDQLWPADAEPIARLGLRGGFFHPTTGYSMPDAAANALFLANQTDFSSVSLHTAFRHRASTLWNKRRFYQLLNRMLFRAAEPSQRYRVLEHFYRLDEGLIGRFYAGRLTALDKIRILSGRPPVSVGRAIRAMRAGKA